MQNITKLIFTIFIGLSLHCDSQDIFDAARKGNISKLQELIKIKPDTVNSKNENGFTPLIIAGYRNQLTTVEFLLNNGAGINVSSPEGSVILGACYLGNFELTELLIKYKADVNAQNPHGTSALIYAVLSNNTELVKLLLKHGAKKDLVEKSGKTALGYAKVRGLTEMVPLLSN